ncbi:MAG: DUF6165 family protein [Lysobacterales bacterium]
MSMISVPVSFGELLDKMSILEIKLERIADPAKRANVARELDALRVTWSHAPESQQDIAEVLAQLKGVNEQLWEIEDEIRDLEREQRFDARFVELARSVYITNDERARLKRVLNEALGSALVEEKSYASYR